MAAPERRLPEVYVMPGEARLVKGACILRTLLGSCVGVTFWVPRLNVAALCHGMLPRAPLSGPGPELSQAAGLRYVDFAICTLACQLSARGALRDEVQIKLFGGADVLDVSNQGERPTVGRLNCESAISVLAAEGFAYTASSLGGTCGLDIRFNTQSGEVLLRRLNTIDQNALSARAGRPASDQSNGKR